MDAITFILVVATEAVAFVLEHILLVVRAYNTPPVIVITPASPLMTADIAESLPSPSSPRHRIPFSVLSPAAATVFATPVPTDIPISPSLVRHDSSSTDTTLVDTTAIADTVPTQIVIDVSVVNDTWNLGPTRPVTPTWTSGGNLGTWQDAIDRQNTEQRNTPWPPSNPELSWRDTEIPSTSTPMPPSLHTVFLFAENTFDPDGHDSSLDSTASATPSTPFRPSTLPIFPQPQSSSPTPLPTSASMHGEPFYVTILRRRHLAATQSKARHHA
ncbi:hypothetical protein EIP91_008457 [Steccherinum ochraceum]|uniref:Uncharacterized protein n=1 Tax=Steccherinum ochraceum TaxID=92696 RepID=A0A4R0RKX4_9APHY|nr:hypothetical protein EIP91_008457 [Steccherinum ochraceum]